jgi:hypothetical protein
MQMTDLLNEIKLDLSGGLLELEIEDAVIEQIIKKSLREIEGFWDETTLITIPFSSCIDLANSELDLKEKVVSIVKVYRTQTLGTASTSEYGYNDPIYMQQWAIFSGGGTIYSLSDYTYNYAAYAELTRLKNSLSTDMAFKEDKHNNKLYINSAQSTPQYITVEYIPKLISVEQIKDEYWINNLIKLATAQTKIILGRIRTRFTQSNALWTQDGETLLNEGKDELKELRDMLLSNQNLVYPID